MRDKNNTEGNLNSKNINNDIKATSSWPHASSRNPEYNKRNTKITTKINHTV